MVSGSYYPSANCNKHINRVRKSLDQHRSGEIKILDEKLSGEIKTLEEKNNGLSKRIDSTELINRGIFIGLMLAIWGEFAKIFGLVENP